MSQRKFASQNQFQNTVERCFLAQGLGDTRWIKYYSTAL